MPARNANVVMVAPLVEPGGVCVCDESGVRRPVLCRCVWQESGVCRPEDVFALNFVYADVL